MMQLTRLRYSVVAIICAVSLLSPPVTTAAQSSVDSLVIPIVGTVVGGGTFVGNFALQQFQARNGIVVAIGTLTGTLTTVAGQVISVVTNLVLPVATQAVCDILHLDLGPLAIDLLGLQINLSRVVLDINAEAGAGNLLGNLLCAVSGLLDNPNGLARLLNEILALLN